MNRPIRPNRPGLQGSSRNTALLAGGGTLFELKAAPDTTTSTSLAWNEPEYKPDNYRVERSLDGTTFSTVTTLANTVFDYNDTGRTESTQYWYLIVPILGGVDQTASNIADTWTVPSTPTSLTATAISSTQINLAWTDVSTGNTAQIIERRSPAGSGSYSFIASVGATATSYNDTGLTLATQYEYQVAATNPATQSAWSTAANATTTGGGPPSASWTLDFSSGEPWSNGTNYVFSSTASTSRTFVDSSGYVAPCVANLLLHSRTNNDTSWSMNGSTKPSTTETAPNNAAEAVVLRDNTAGTYHFFLQDGVAVSASTQYVYSCYFKANALSHACISMVNSTNTTGIGVVFSLSGSGSVTQTNLVGSPLNTSSGIENVGNGWYRCWVSQQTLSSGFTSARCFVCSSNSGTPASVGLGMPIYAGSTQDAINVWGAQLVTGSAPLPYSATTTSSNGIPRLTHNSSGSRLGLLVEEQRANLAQRSGEFENAYWNDASNATCAGVASPAAPDNSADAAELTETTATGIHARGRNAVNPTAGIVTWSAYVKKQSRRYVGLYLIATNTYNVIFDLDNGAAFSAAQSVGTPNGSYGSEDVGNGWYRIWVTMNTGGSGTPAAYPGVFLSDRAGFTGTLTSNMPSYTGSTSESVYVWGLQFEAAATPSSYIPTTTASVTRSADLAYVETADVTNWGRPGSFVVEYYKPLEQSGGVVVADDDGAGNAGRLGLEYSAGGPRIVYGTSGSGSGGTDTAGLNKVGWAWDGSGAATRSALNGSALDTSLATSFDPTLTDGINLGGNIDWSTLPLTVSGQPNVVIRRVRFWNSQLSAADLNTLTT